MTNAVNLAQYANNSPSWRNRIINGAMAIDQRNNGAAYTQVDAAIADAYVLDRWKCGISSFGGGTGSRSIQRVADAPTGFTYSMKYTVNTTLSGGRTNQIWQSIEGYNCADLSGQNITISFWAKASTALSATVGVYGTTATTTSVSITTSWAQYTVSITAPTVSSSTSSEGLLLIFIMSGMVTGNSINITGVQLEKGTTATNFEYRDYGRELIMCQRYYQLFRSYYAFAGNSSTAYISTVFPVAMRTGPTMSIYGSVLRLSDNTADYTSSGSFSSQSVYESGTRFAQSGYSGLSAGKFYIGYGDVLAASAEL